MLFLLFIILISVNMLLFVFNVFAVNSVLFIYVLSIIIIGLQCFYFRIDVPSVMKQYLNLSWLLSFSFMIVSGIVCYNMNINFIFYWMNRLDYF